MLSAFLKSKVNNHTLLSDRAYINGIWCHADSEEIINVTNPANNEVIATIPNMEINEAKKAINAAYEALPLWKSKLPKERANIIRRWYDLIIENKADIVNIMVAENGKTIRDAEGEFNYGSGFVEWFAEEAKRIHGDVYPVDKPGHRYLGIKEPIGVVAAITPWNFPFAMITRKVTPAIAAGCTMVLKPAELTPLTALALARLAEQAGMPPGVLNIITGNPKAIGSEFTSNKIVKKISFTGSTEVGKLLFAQCANTVKRLSLELGGNAPCVVFDDANIDLAVNGVIAGKMRNTGQSCTNINRVFIQKKISKLFTEKLIEKYSELKLGNGFDSDSDQGPLINQQAVEKIGKLIEDAVKHDGKILYQSKKPDTGTFYPLTVIKLPTHKLQIHDCEIFGPVLAIYEFDDENEVINICNNTNYGLAAYFYTNDQKRCWSFAEQLQFGMVGINESLISTSEFIPFGGVKESGFGVEGSKYGIEEFLKIKYFCMGNL